ncbi:MAG: hypothetical protein K9M56_09880 [Victivallales bacterium]|nr:hypothetical protein [Victivallales bacterium]
MKFSKINKCAFSAVLGLLLLFISGCETLDMDFGMSGDIPKWTVSINEIVKYPRGTLGEKKVQSFDGRPIWVRKHYEFCSKSIKSIEAIPSEEKEGFYKLRLKLDRHGALVAMRLCNDPAHDPWALLINGVFYRTVDFADAPLNNDHTEIELPGPFGSTVANNLEKYSKENYEYYHRND